MSALRSIARGFNAMGDPPPGPLLPGTLSTPAAYLHGAIRMVGSMGKQREATYRQIYLLNPWVYAATNHIARGIARLPLHTFALDADGNKTRIRCDVPQTPGRPVAGVALDRLLNYPEAGLSRQAFYGATMRERLILGNALWQIVRDGAGMPTGLQRIAWRRVIHIQEDDDGNALWYDIIPAYGAGPRKRLMPADVVHFGLGADIERAWNVSLLESCQHTIALHEAIMRHLMGYYENSMRPSGMFKAESAKEAKEARALITELYTSPENAGKVLVTNATWQAMADSPDHAQIVQLVQESRVEVAAAFQVPPPTLGLLEHAIRANVKEMREQFGRDTIGPWASEFEGELAGQLLPQVPSWSSLFNEFQLAEMLRPDLEARALVYQRMMWIYSIDEIRGFENRPPLGIKGVTDVPWAPSGATPVTTAAQAKVGRIPAQNTDSGDGEPSSGPLPEIVTMLAQLDAIEEAIKNGSNGHRLLSEVT